MIIFVRDWPGPSTGCTGSDSARGTFPGLSLCFFWSHKDSRRGHHPTGVVWHGSVWCVLWFFLQYATPRCLCGYHRMLCHLCPCTVGRCWRPWTYPEALSPWPKLLHQPSELDCDDHYSLLKDFRRYPIRTRCFPSLAFSSLSKCLFDS